MPIHVCPVCGQHHQISVVLDRLVAGRRFTCSPRCKAAWPKLVRARVIREIEERRRAGGHADAED